jgi:glycosyltransferase involved in cell wall biosynthesis
VSAGAGPGGAAPSLLWVNHFAVSPREGGGTRHFEVGRELVRLGWRVQIAASDVNLHTRAYTRRAGPHDRATLDETVDGVRFRWLWAAPYERNDWRRVWNWGSFGVSLLRDRESARPDVVIGSSPHLFAGWAALRLARRARVPFVLEVRDLWPESVLAVNGGGGRGPGYRAFEALARHLYASADRIVVLARGTGDYLARERGIDPRRIVYVPNGVDAGAFASIARPPRDTFTLVYAGAHGPANGLDAVLDAADRLRGRPEIRFLLVGDGAVKADLVRAAAQRRLGNVEFRDSVAKAQMPDLLAEADAGLMVLRDAPLFAFGVSPNKLFDYLGAGLPVVCNVPGEVAGMLQAADAGVQADDASGDALARAVVRLAEESHARRARRGETGRAWVAREHGREVLARRLDAALREVLPR